MQTYRVVVVNWSGHTWATPYRFSNPGQAQRWTRFLVTDPAVKSVTVERAAAK